jgi:hypothetical protein
VAVDRSQEALGYEDCLRVLLEFIGRRAEVMIVPASDEPILYAAFKGTLERASDDRLWADVAGSREAMAFNLREDRSSGFVLYRDRFRSAYSGEFAGKRGVSIEQDAVRLDVWLLEE